MTLALGTRLGPYEIVSLLGAGGMGEVYRARDTKLDRDVALKVLPAAFAKDAERMARFKREAQVLASLSHPNIAAVYGLEESGSVRALVMELVEGPTLAERLKSGAIPLEDALAVAKQIAEALEASHEKSVIHRDLKPANIKLNEELKVKVLDFGLAKALETEGSASAISHSPTLSEMATQAGVILGTAAYMSPEQAKGKAVDRRADIWAFGCVLYEMLTGKRTFGGETVSDVLAAVIRAEPDFAALPPDTPPKIRDLLRRALNKEPKNRLRDIGDARIAIEETLDPSKAIAIDKAGWTEPPRARRTQTIIWGLAVLAALSIGLALWSLLRTPSPPTRPIAHLSVTLPPSDRLALGLTPAIALSPDGSRLLYVAKRAGTNQLYVRPIDRLEATPISGTEGGESPFFSPDGQSVGFFAEGKLKRVSLSGGAPLTLCGAATPRGASWGSDESIIFTPSLAYSGLFRVSGDGGTPKALTTPDNKQGEISHRWPQILPGGKAVLFSIWSGGPFDDSRIVVLSLETGEQRTLIHGGTSARYVSSGHLVYGRAGELLAVPFDLKQLKVTGHPVSILQAVRIVSTTGAVEFSSSADGSLAYVPGGPSGGERILLWVDRLGAAQPLPAPPRSYFAPRLSPDGRRVALGIAGTTQGLWLYELARDTLSRLAETALLPFPIWTPDGKRLTFSLAQEGPWNIFWMPSDGSGAPERLAATQDAQWPGSWSPDGQVLAYTEASPTMGYDIWVLSIRGQRKAQPFLQTPSNESGPTFAPDGRWLAYQSDESGRQEIYVRPFPGPGGKFQISTEGGTEPVWARDGRELFYRNGDKMMAAAIETKAGFAAAKPRYLFERPYEPAFYTFGANYDVSPDGRRFLMIKAAEQETGAARINVVLNWFEDLKRRVPAGK
jgi:serine/threonine-protein kinase